MIRDSLFRAWNDYFANPYLELHRIKILSSSFKDLQTSMQKFLQLMSYRKTPLNKKLQDKWFRKNKMTFLFACEIKNSYPRNRESLSIRWWDWKECFKIWRKWVRFIQLKMKTFVWKGEEGNEFDRRLIIFSRKKGLKLRKLNVHFCEMQPVKTSIFFSRLKYTAFRLRKITRFTQIFLGKIFLQKIFPHPQFNLFFKIKFLWSFLIIFPISLMIYSLEKIFDNELHRVISTLNNFDSSPWIFKVEKSAVYF